MENLIFLGVPILKHITVIFNLNISNICCDPSSEQTRSDHDSNRASQCMFLFRIKKIKSLTYPQKCTYSEVLSQGIEDNSKIFFFPNKTYVVTPH